MKYLSISIWFFLVVLLQKSIVAQDLEPRFLSNAPTNTNVFLMSYAYSSGNIMLDDALPIEDLSSNLNSAVIAYVRTFKTFNCLSKAGFVIPATTGTFSGVVSAVDSSTSRTGFGDPTLMFSTILIGASPLAPGEFFQQEAKKFKLGASVKVRLPSGKYDKTKLINLGTNRYSTRLGLAASYTFRKKLILESHLNWWFFTDNDEFWNGNLLEQKPMLGLQTHIVYEFKPGIWAAVSYGGSRLGETRVNGVDKNDAQKSARTGAAFSFRISKSSSIKLATTTGVTARYGSDYTTVLIAYQYLWFDKK